MVERLLAADLVKYELDLPHDGLRLGKVDGALDRRQRLGCRACAGCWLLLRLLLGVACAKSLHGGTCELVE